MLNIKCAICENNNSSKILYKQNFNSKVFNSKVFSARRIPDRTHYRFLKCSKCGLIFSNPIIERDKINSLYFKSDFNYNQEAQYLKKTYFNYFKKYLLRTNYKKAKVLEIGCGNGFLLEELKDNGIKNIYGLEPGKLSVDKARKDIRNRIKVDILRKNIFPKESFDIICCFHTLDHIVDINIFLKEVNRLLKINGKVFFVVHNTNGLSVKLFGEKSPIFDIEHIYLFNPNSLMSIFNKYGFNKLKVFNVNNTYPLNYWVKLFPMPNIIKQILFKIFYVTKIGLIPLTLGAGNIGIVGDKQ